jgi:3-phosphoshikimate 1-carboxyvinyltransferase
MIAVVKKSKLQGAVTAPSSKSGTQRACAAAWIRGGRTILQGVGESDDEKAALQILSQWGARIEMKDNRVVIEFLKGRKAGDIHCGESGLSLRMFTPLAATYAEPIQITGEGSLPGRPLHFFDEVLPQLNVRIASNAGYLPLRVQGPLQPRDIAVDGSLSSQFLTGLLMAYAASEATGRSIHVKNLKSKPYIDLTLDIMKAFGLPVPNNRNYEEFVFGNEKLPVPPGEIEYRIEADWSGAAFLLVAGAIAGPVTVRGLDLLSRQADRAILDFLMEANAGIAMDAKGIVVHRAEMQAFFADATDCPDLFPPLVVLASACAGVSRIRGVHRLLHKESNRALTLQSEFGKTGVRVEWRDDEMLVHGARQIDGNRVSSHGDHRIAMALAIHALRCEGEMVIEQAEAVTKSYPGFFRDLQSLGAGIRLQ